MLLTLPLQSLKLIPGFFIATFRSFDIFNGYSRHLFYSLPIYLFLLSGFCSVWGHDNPRQFRVSQCLGREEEMLHQKKSRGVAYVLNQQLLSSFLNLPDVTLSDDVYHRACEAQNDSPSIYILEEIFLKYEKAFAWVDVKKTGPVTAIKLEEIFSQLADLFNIYYLLIQNSSPDITCLERKIPRLGKFLIELKYLSQELTFKTIGDRDGQLNIILAGLKKAPTFFKECQNELKSTDSAPSEKPSEKPNASTNNKKVK